MKFTFSNISLNYFCRILLTLCLLYCPAILADSVIYADILKAEDYRLRYNLALRGQKAIDIKDYTPTKVGSQREIVEMIILQKALYLGGEKSTIAFNPKDSLTLREVTSLVKGDSLLYGNTLWFEMIKDYQGSLYISDPLIRYGEYEAGFYTSRSNKKALSTTMETLKDLKVITSSQWGADWRALHNSPVQTINFMGSWIDMLSMVEYQVVDAMLINFSLQEDLSLMFDDKTYIPIPNIKIMLPGSRHFVVSKKHPNGAQVFNALNKGIKIMRESGEIEKLYRQAGFINSKVKGWSLANSTMLTVDAK
ncbi:transporter substrate-binding domain-containing protein [Colwellia sp. D2M02]|uniref:transporter substrate-binding domain-containing protein n=1 Tax=Colwellia sp. D2M02 TaxID=2841562 RepID=UPI001C09EC9D|nr:transporter substrate-binding domain-containing protein [Colwellia sp. D2M02]MBU2892380.1 transporter substrate-binding domain-containing protein [Colwellia sp. D2M02]